MTVFIAPSFIGNYRLTQFVEGVNRPSLYDLEIDFPTPLDTAVYHYLERMRLETLPIRIVKNFDSVFTFRGICAGLDITLGGAYSTSTLTLRGDASFLPELTRESFIGLYSDILDTSEYIIGRADCYRTIKPKRALHVMRGSFLERSIQNNSEDVSLVVDASSLSNPSVILATQEPRAADILSVCHDSPFDLKTALPFLRKEDFDLSLIRVDNYAAVTSNSADYVLYDVSAEESAEQLKVLSTKKPKRLLDI